MVLSVRASCWLALALLLALPARAQDLRRIDNDEPIALPHLQNEAARPAGRVLERGIVDLGGAAPVTVLRPTLNRADRIELRLDLPSITRTDLTLEDGLAYTRFDVPGAGQMAEGRPDVPVFSRWLLLPSGAKPELNITAAPPRRFKNIDPAPVQPPEADSYLVPRAPFARDAAVYAADQAFPGPLAELGPIVEARGQFLAQLHIYPVQVNPVARTATIHPELDITLTFAEAARPAAAAVAHPVFDSLLTRLAINGPTVQQARRDAAKDTDAPEADDPEPLGGGDGCELLIICPPALADSAETLAAWRRRSGTLTRVATTDQTGAANTQIEAYIDASQAWSPAPVYVLLLGDAELIPTFYVLDHAGSAAAQAGSGLDNGKVASDRYYGDTNGDMFQELFVGRIPVDTLAEAERAVARIIDYELSPPDPQTWPDFYTRAALVAYFQDTSPTDTYADRRFAKTSEDVYQYLIHHGLQADRIYYTEGGITPLYWYGGSTYSFENDGDGGLPVPNELRKPAFPWSGNKLDITAAVNAGRFLLMHRDHGSRRMYDDASGAYYAGGWADPQFLASDVDALSNGAFTPVVFSINCSTGWFDNETDADPHIYYTDGQPKYSFETRASEESFCERFFTDDDGGAVGVICDTRVSYSGRNDRLAWGFMDAIWPDFIEYHQGDYGDGEPIRRMGPVLEYGKQYMLTRYSNTSEYTKTAIDEFIYFGDPSMEIRTGLPLQLAATHPFNLETATPTDVTIDVTRGGAAAAGARVTISRAEVPGDYWTGTTDAQGRVTFGGVSLSVPGDYDVVAVARDSIPYQGALNAGGGVGDPPEFLGIDAAPPTAGIGRQVTLTFSSTLELEANPGVSVNGHAATFYSSHNQDYTYHYTIQAADPEGFATISVTGRSTGGQDGSATDETQLFIDRTGPDFTIDTVSPATAGDGDRVYITFTTSEALAADPTVTVNGNAAAHLDQTGLQYVYMYVASAADGEGPATIAIAASDFSGNPGSLSDATRLTIDAAAPTFSAPAATPGLAGEGRLVSIAFQSSEPLAGNPTVTVNGRAAAYQSRAGLDYTYAYTAVAADGDAAATIAIAGEDAAGNPGTRTDSDALWIDAVAPGFSAISASPSAAGLGVPVTLEVTASEALANPPALTVNGRAATFTGADGLTYSYSYTTRAADGEGPATLAAGGADPAGNTAAKTVTDQLTIDTVAPLIGAIDADPAAAGLGQGVAISFGVSETPAAQPTVAVNGRAAAFETVDGLDYTYRYTPVTADGDAPAHITIDVSDAFGNAAVALADDQLIIDAVAPTFSAISATPSAAGLGQTVRIDVTADEALAAAPLVTVNGRAANPAGGAGADFAFDYTVVALDGDGPATIAVSGADLLGNPAQAQSTSALSIDATAPAFTDLLATPAEAREGQPVALTFSSSEPLVAAPTVTVNGRAAALQAAAGLDYAFVYTPVPADGEGPATLRIEGTDLIGNPVSLVDSAALTIDAVAPVLLLADVTPAAAALGQTITFTLAASEPLDAAPVATVNGRAAALHAVAGLDYTYAYVTVAADGDAAAAIAATATDTPGNPATFSDETSLHIDTVAPSFLGLVATPDAAALGDPVQIAFAASEPPAAAPTVTVNGRAASLTNVNGLDYTYAYTPVAADGDAPATIAIRGADTVGNPGELNDSAALRIDAIAPTLSIASASPSPIGLGQSATIAVEADEALAAPPALSVNGRTASLSGQDGLSYAFSYTAVAADGDGPATCFASATDALGNAGTATDATRLVIDALSPAITGLVADPAVARPGQTVTLTFDVDEALAAPPTVMVNATPATLDSHNAPTWTFTWLVAGGEPTGPAAISVSLSDLVGNPTANEAFDVLTIDAEGPVFSNLAATPAVARLGDDVTLTFDASEALAAPPGVTVNGRAAALLAQDGLRWTYIYGAVAADGESPATIAISGEDAAGNPGTLNDDHTLVIDAVAPTLSALVATPALVGLGRDVTIGFEVSEALAADPLVTLNGRHATLASALGDAYTYRYTTGLDDVDGPATIECAFTDAIGNAATVQRSDLLTLDVTPPDFTLDTVTPAAAGLGDTVTLTLTAAETLAAPTTVTVNGRTAILTADAAPTFSYAWAPAPVDGDGAATIEIDGIDLAGNRTRWTDTASLHVDTVGPELTLSAGTSAARLGEVVALTLDANEPLAAAPELSVNGRAAGLTAAAGLQFTYAYTVTPADGEGPAMFAASAADPVGNPATLVAADALQIDAVAPAVVAFDVTPAAIALGETAVLDVTLSEAPVTTPVLTVNGRAATPTGWTALTCAFEYTAIEADGEAEAAIALAFADAAGNPGSHLVSDALSIDAIAPTFQTLEVNPGTAALGQSVEIEVSASEPLIASPTMTVNGRPATLIADDGGLFTFSYTTVPADGHGPATLHVAGVDALGNPGSLTDDVTLEIDAVAPSFGSLSATPPAAGLGQTVLLRLSASEPMAAPPDVTVNGRTATLDSQQGLIYSYRYTTVNEDGDAAALIAITGADAVGNPTTAADQGTLWIDTAKPAFTDFTASPSPAAAGSRIALSVTSSEDLPGAPQLTVNGRAATPDGLDGRTWRYRYTAQPLDGDGPATIRVSGADAVGNAAQATDRDALHIDTVAPTLTSCSVQPRLARAGDPVTVNVSLSEPQATTPTLSINGRPATWNGFDGASHTFGYTVDAADPCGPIALSLAARDIAGNDASHQWTGACDFDNTAPRGSVTINEGSLFTSETLITLHMSATDQGSSLSTVESVLLSSDSLTWTPPRPYSDRTTWSLAPGDGPQFVYVCFVDTAGNLSPLEDGSRVIVLDRTPPQANLGKPETVPGELFVTLNWTYEDPNLTGSGVAEVEVCWRPRGMTAWRVIGCFAPETTTTDFDARELGTGHYEFCAIARDSAGNREPICDEAEVTAHLWLPGASAAGSSWDLYR